MNSLSDAIGFQPQLKGALNAVSLCVVSTARPVGDALVDFACPLAIQLAYGENSAHMGPRR